MVLFASCSYTAHFLHLLFTCPHRNGKWAWFCWPTSFSLFSLSVCVTTPAHNLSNASMNTDITCFSFSLRVSQLFYKPLAYPWRLLHVLYAKSTLITGSSLEFIVPSFLIACRVILKYCYMVPSFANMLEYMKAYNSGSVKIDSVHQLWLEIPYFKLPHSYVGLICKPSESTILLHDLNSLAKNWYLFAETVKQYIRLFFVIFRYFIKFSFVFE